MSNEEGIKNIIEIINTYFSVVIYEREGSKITVHVKEEYLDIKKFRELRREIQAKGYVILAKPFSQQSGFYFELLKLNLNVSPSSLRMPLILFLVTTITIFLSGYFILFPSLLISSLIYTFALLCILGIHELGHYMMAKAYRLKTSLPFFIPGFPFGTFGAIIRLKEPFADRFQAFDVGIAGPIFGFIPTIIFLTIGMNFSSFSDSSSIDRFTTPIPFLMQLIFSIYVPAGSTLLLHPLAFAAFLGLIVTFLNMTPVSQLDGGHVINSLLGANYSLRYVLAFVSFVILIYTGFVAMAFISLFLMFYNVDPLNHVNKLDKRRKIYGIFFLILWLLLVPWPFTNYSLGTLE